MRITLIRLAAGPLVDARASGLFGGAEVRAFTFAQGLAERTAHEVHFVVAAREANRKWNLGPLQIDTLPMRRAQAGRRLADSLRRRIASEPCVWAELAQLPADLYCCFGLHDPSASIIRTARLRGARSVLFLTSDADTLQALAPDAPSDRRRRWHRYAIEQADLIVAQTEQQRDRIAQAGRHVVLIRNPLDLTLPAEGLTPWHSRRHLLWIGRADTDCKRADLCLQLAAKLPHVPLVMVINPQDRRTTARLLAQVPAHVQVVPQVAWRASDRLFREARALVNTSDSEGFPNAFLQAGKFGVPVLSRRVNPDQVLTRHGWGFVADDDLVKLADRMRDISEWPERYEHAAAAARRYVEQFHALPDRVAELELALLRLASCRAAG